MPTYVYKCDTCGKTREVRHSIHEDPEIMCDEGHEPTVMKRLIFAPVVMYRGEGWTLKESKNDAAGIPPGVAKTAEKLGRL